MDASTTRAELERLINSSIRPLYIKQEILEGDSKMVVEAMEEDNDDILKFLMNDDPFSDEVIIHLTEQVGVVHCKIV